MEGILKLLGMRNLAAAIALGCHIGHGPVEHKANGHLAGQLDLGLGRCEDGTHFAGIIGGQANV
jgi:hypothetical protein